MHSDTSGKKRRAASLARACGFAVITFLVAAVPAVAQDAAGTGRVKVHVHPKQAYVFVDGQAIRDGSQTLRLSPGKHTVGVYNYGYSPVVQTVDLTAGQTMRLGVTLQRRGETVAGPFGDIEFKGYPRAAVLLNGTTPGFFVGHVDEFDNNWLWHQWLLVHPGTYQVLVTREGRTIWKGPVSVAAGQRVVVDLNHGGRMTTDSFKRGFSLPPEPRFDAGVASAMVPIAPVTARLAASIPQPGCRSADLKWTVSGAVETSISHIGTVPETGDRTVHPDKPTTYFLVAKGPGGEATERATVNVTVPALALSQPEVRYHKVGDDVVTQGSATLSWSAPNAKSVTIDPLGAVSDSGRRVIEATPGSSAGGPIDRDMTYTMRVTDPCGDTTTRTATLHVVGSVDPAPAVTLASVFYPTEYPERGHPRVGLVASEKRMLDAAATAFKDNEPYERKDMLLVVGHADVRGPDGYNMALSRRRAAVVKAYLVSRGIPADRIDIRADGKRKELTVAEVRELQAQDVQQPPKWMSARWRTTWLAYNRRVDLILEPAGERSKEAYPNGASDARLLWERPVPALKAVEADATMARAGAQPLAGR